MIIVKVKRHGQRKSKSAKGIGQQTKRTLQRIVVSSVTRLGVLLYFGELLKHLATINFPKSHILREKL